MGDKEQFRWETRTDDLPGPAPKLQEGSLEELMMGDRPGDFPGPPAVE